MSSDPVLATQVQTILANPVSAQHPDLVHFRPPAPGLTAAVPPSPPAPPAIPDPPDLRLPILVTALAFGLAGLWVLGEMRSRGGQWSLRRALLQIAGPFAGAVVVAAGAATFAVLGGLWAPPPTAPLPEAAPAATTVSMLSSQRSHSVWLSAGSGSQTWKSLASIESAIDSQHVKLVSDEQQIAAVTTQLGAAAQTPTADALRPSTPGLLKSELQQLVTDHQAVLGSYNDSLQREYSFYVATAQSSESTAELTSVAAYAPPEVHRAITTNLTLVQTQLQQEAEITAASAAELARLQAAGTEVADLSGPAPSFDAPVNGVLTQPFGTTQLALEPPITYNGVFYPHFHTGLDLAAPLDTQVHAAAAGRVVLAASSVDDQGHLTGYGNFVLIAHADGYNTLYAHLDRIEVTVGQTVQQGEQIGLLGTTGWSTGPHVHFEVRKGAVYVDPAPYLGAQIGQS